MECITCGAELAPYDIGFYKKMVSRGAEEFACIGCTSEYFGIDTGKAWEMIRRFQDMGCLLFPSPEPKE